MPMASGFFGVPATLPAAPRTGVNFTLFAGAHGLRNGVRRAAPKRRAPSKDVSMHADHVLSSQKVLAVHSNVN
jgi:hypothetical protein